MKYMIAIVVIVIIAMMIFGGFISKQRADQARQNKLNYSQEIRETTKECLSNTRSNPQVQNFNDDNEIVETCTNYALDLYNARY